MPPQVNAQLRTISARGSTDDFHPADEDVVVFDGSVDAWYDQTRRRVTAIGSQGGAISDVIMDHTLLLDPLPVRPDVGQEVTFDYRGTTWTGIIQAVEDPILASVPAYMNTVTLTLELQ